MIIITRMRKQIKNTFLRYFNIYYKTKRLKTSFDLNDIIIKYCIKITYNY